MSKIILEIRDTFRLHDDGTFIVFPELAIVSAFDQHYQHLLRKLATNHAILENKDRLFNNYPHVYKFIWPKDKILICEPYPPGADQFTSCLGWSILLDTGEYRFIRNKFSDNNQARLLPCNFRKVLMLSAWEEQIRDTWPEVYDKVYNMSPMKTVLHFKTPVCINTSSNRDPQTNSPAVPKREFYIRSEEDVSNFPWNDLKTGDVVNLPLLPLYQKTSTNKKISISELVSIPIPDNTKILFNEQNTMSTSEPIENKVVNVIRALPDMKSKTQNTFSGLPDDVRDKLNGLIASDNTIKTNDTAFTLMELLTKSDEKMKMIDAEFHRLQKELNRINEVAARLKRAKEIATIDGDFLPLAYMTYPGVQMQLTAEELSAVENKLKSV